MICWCSCNIYFSESIYFILPGYARRVTLGTDIEIYISRDINTLCKYKKPVDIDKDMNVNLSRFQRDIKYITCLEICGNSLWKFPKKTKIIYLFIIKWQWQSASSFQLYGEPDFVTVFYTDILKNKTKPFLYVHRIYHYVEKKLYSTFIVDGTLNMYGIIVIKLRWCTLKFCNFYCELINSTAEWENRVNGISKIYSRELISAISLGWLVELMLGRGAL